MNAIQANVQLGDFIIFNSSCNGVGLGQIINANHVRVKVSLLNIMDSEAMKRHRIKPVTAESFPVAAQDGMVEVYQTSEEIFVDRTMIKDVAFILPLQEVESGMFFLAGAENTFFIRYIFSQNTMQMCNPSVYFSRYLIEPLGVRLFTAMNTLSQHLTRSMYHQAESELSSKSFRLPLFSMESFMYLAYKLQGHSAETSILRKQSVIKYLKTLKMEYYCKTNTLSYIRIMSVSGLNVLRRVLGAGVGLGLTKSRPSKKNPVGYCTMGGILTSIECGVMVPQAVMQNPEIRSTANGIDFIFSEQNRNLNCNIRFTKIVIKEATDATSRLPTAQVTSAESDIYIGVWFQHNGELLEILEINGETVTCSYVEDLNQDNVELPVGLVTELVAKFGKQ